MTWVALQENKSWSPLDLLHPLFRLSNPFKLLIFCRDTKGFVKQIRLMQRNDDDSPQHLVHHNHLRDLRIAVDFFDKFEDFGFFFELVPYIRV